MLEFLRAMFLWHVSDMGTHNLLFSFNKVAQSINAPFSHYMNQTCDCFTKEFIRSVQQNSEPALFFNFLIVPKLIQILLKRQPSAVSSCLGKPMRNKNDSCCSCSSALSLAGDVKSFFLCKLDINSEL